MAAPAKIIALVDDSLSSGVGTSDPDLSESDALLATTLVTVEEASGGRGNADRGRVEDASAKRKEEGNRDGEPLPEPRQESIYDSRSRSMRAPSDLSTVAVVEVVEAEASGVTVAVEAVKCIEVEATSQVEGTAHVVTGRIPAAEEANRGIAGSDGEKQQTVAVGLFGMSCDSEKKRLAVNFIGWGAVEARLKPPHIDLLLVFNNVKRKEVARWRWETPPPTAWVGLVGPSPNRKGDFKGLCAFAKNFGTSPK